MRSNETNADVSALPAADLVPNYRSAAAAYSAMVYGRQELGLDNIHRWIAKSIGVPEPEFIVSEADDSTKPDRPEIKNDRVDGVRARRA
jgi:hypothetical protein